MRKRQVTFLQRVLTDYRIPFFDALYERMSSMDMTLSVLAGYARTSDGLLQPEIQRPYLHRVNNLYLGGGFYWQRLIAATYRSSDLVIMEQRNRLLHTYPILLRRRLVGFPTRVAFWGHGRNFNYKSHHHPAEYWKRWWTRLPDHWFAYTALSAQVVQSAGVPSNRITIVNNASDTSALQKAMKAIAPDDQDRLHAALWNEQRTPEHQTGVFCSRLLPSKGIDLLLESCLRVKQHSPLFRLLIIGDGPCRRDVETFARQHPWCVYHPPVYGAERAPLLSLADLWLNPGTVGLSILDAFACGIPFLTVQRLGHGPEIAYLNASNGLITEASSAAFSQEIVSLLDDHGRRETLRQGASRSAQCYTLENMVSHFCEGLQLCIDDASSRSLRKTIEPNNQST